ncbi:MAG: hypothetical protein BWY76_01461 [bacterium ADurb.Bin429]|nr:MAG: hypothetical protein BWY76_01461 [bacterium ADurb.Bin429]
MLAVEMPVVGGEDHQRVLRQPQRLYPVENPADIFVHQADHAIVYGDVLRQRLAVVQMRMETVQAVPRFAPRPKVRMCLLGQLEVRRIAVMLARLAPRYGNIRRFIHRVPRFRCQIGRMWVEKTRPQEERFVSLRVIRHQRVRALGDPAVVMELLRNEPLPALARIIAGGRLKIIAPVQAPLLLHPEGVVLPGMRFIHVVASQLNVTKAVERPMEAAPELQVLHDRVRLQRGIFLRPAQRLEVRLAHQCRAVARGVKILAHGVRVLRQLSAQRPCAVLAGILPGDNGCPGGGAGGIRAVGAGEARALCRQPVEVRRAHFGVGDAQGVPVLLVAGDEQDIRSGHERTPTSAGRMTGSASPAATMRPISISANSARTAAYAGSATRFVRSCGSASMLYRHSSV